MELPSEIRRVLAHIDQNQGQYVARLAEAVAIRSVSQEKECRPQTAEAVHHFKRVSVRVKSPLFGVL